MKKLILIAPFYLFISFANAEGLEEYAQNLNQQSQSQLGISLKALSFLIEYSERTVSPDYLKATGQIKYFNELLEAEYIEVVEPTTSMELPLGQDFKKIKTTTKGLSIISGVSNSP